MFVYRLDRNFAKHLTTWLFGRNLVSVIISATEPTGDSPTEKLVESRILAGFAQLDNTVFVVKGLKWPYEHRYKSGLISGKPPIGYKFEVGYTVEDAGDMGSRPKSAWEK